MYPSHLGSKYNRFNKMYASQQISFITLIGPKFTPEGNMTSIDIIPLRGHSLFAAELLPFSIPNAQTPKTSDSGNETEKTQETIHCVSGERSKLQKDLPLFSVKKQNRILGRVFTTFAYVCQKCKNTTKSPFLSRFTSRRMFTALSLKVISFGRLWDTHRIRTLRGSSARMELMVPDAFPWLPIHQVSIHPPE